MPVLDVNGGIIGDSAGMIYDGIKGLEILRTPRKQEGRIERNLENFNEMGY